MLRSLLLAVAASAVLATTSLAGAYDYGHAHKAKSYAPHYTPKASYQHHYKPAYTPKHDYGYKAPSNYAPKHYTPKHYGHGY